MQGLICILATFHCCVGIFNLSAWCLLLQHELTLSPRVNTTVFGFSPGNLFNVDNLANRALVISSIAAAIGLFVDIWFISAYSGADVRTFQVGLLPDYA